MRALLRLGPLLLLIEVSVFCQEVDYGCLTEDVSAGRYCLCGCHAGGSHPGGEGISAEGITFTGAQVDSSLVVVLAELSSGFLSLRTVENVPYQTHLPAHVTQPHISQNRAATQSIPCVRDSVCLCFLLSEHHPARSSETFCNNPSFFVLVY